ncbi:MAG: bifunctional N-acetylglucosamine-1-phosphate uridyltransferase/glucosamine-1-phosphate acetyltransferase [Candidatus Acididesulfobacter guangdongensis]|uniref:Bifunctional protein GlmU n=1 Tax=Acididesulfobacter guangdongensis TaxID=2597225 RepID=A0A519BGN2_ACIG2|nr:MAG: bifunctional N-acetylglucosamine-1-phosphate uridyltransferase/glucosamine-1-phosphate acetyltransferase [Candidatus Acididesulfobacter guangdongensis]
MDADKINFNYTAVILAGGLGTRMRSEIPKGLTPILEKPMIYYIIAELLRLNDMSISEASSEDTLCRPSILPASSARTAVIKAETGAAAAAASASKSFGCRNILNRIIIVIGHKGEHIKDYIESESAFKNCGITIDFAIQDKYLGTGDAAKQAAILIKTTGHISDAGVQNVQNVLILPCDTPLITKNTLSKLIKFHDDFNDDLTVLSFKTEDPFSYGRVLKDGENFVKKIVEQQEIDAQMKNEHRNDTNIKKTMDNNKENAQAEYLNDINNIKKINDTKYTDDINDANNTNNTDYADDTNNINKLNNINDTNDANYLDNIREVNSGIYAVRLNHFINFIDLIDNDNSKKEYYLTDIVSIFYNNSLKVRSFIGANGCNQDENELMGVNSKIEMVKCSGLMQKRIINNLIEKKDVNFISTDNVYIGSEVQIGKAATLYPGCFLSGNSRIGENTVIECGAIIKDSVIGKNSVIKSYSIIENANVEDEASIGPFARLRPGTHIKNNAKIGNFVEVKNSVIGKNSKASHLSYIGDSEIGDGVNIGAGVITCNYDGFKKHKTIIKNNCFIGSDSQLIAPVTVEKDSYVASGTTVVKNVPEGSLAISRAEQINKEGWTLNRLKRLKNSTKAED